MGPIVLYIHANNWEDPQSRLGVKCKEVKSTFFGHLIPYNAGFRIFQKSILAQTMGSIIFYTHAKNWEDPQSRFQGVQLFLNTIFKVFRAVFNSILTIFQGYYATL